MRGSHIVKATGSERPAQEYWLETELLNPTTAGGSKRFTCPVRNAACRKSFLLKLYHRDSKAPSETEDINKVLEIHWGR